MVSLILRSFQEGTDYSDGTDIIAFVEEIRESEHYIPDELLPNVLRETSRPYLTRCFRPFTMYMPGVGFTT